MSLLLAAAFAAALADPRDILRANNNASGGSAWADKATLRLEYDSTSDGAPSFHDVLIEDLKAPRFRRMIGTEGTAGYDGARYWLNYPKTGLFMRDKGPAMERPIDEAYLSAHLWWRADLGGASAVYTARRSEHGEDFDVITVTPPGSAPIEAWFSVKTGLLARTVSTYGKTSDTSDYTDYRAVDGAMIPGTITDNSGGNVRVFTLTRAEFLPPQDDSTFEP